jgi:hypothetical protein
MKHGKIVLEPNEYFIKDEVITDPDENDPIDGPEEQEEKNDFFRAEKIIYDD